MRFLRALLFLIAFLVVIIISVNVWCSLYRCSDTPLAEKIESDAVARVRARDKVAEDVALNGWTDLSDLVNNRQAPPDPGVLQQATGLLPYSRPGQAKDIELRKEMETPQFQSALKDYEAFQPQLEKVFAKPHFLWPSQWDRGYEATVPNLLVLRKMTQAAVAYADYLRLQGHPGRALAHLLNHVEWAEKLREQGGLLTLMVALGQQNMALEVILESLTSDHLSEQDLKDLLRRLEALPSPVELFRIRMDEEYAYEMQVMQMIRNGYALRDIGPTGLQLLRVSGYMGRERRALQNWYLLQRQYYQSDKLMEDHGLNQGQVMQDFQRHAHSYLLDILAPSTRGAQAIYFNLETHVGAARIVCALRLYQLKHGHPPDQLSQLCPDYLKQLPTNWLGLDKSFTYETDKKDFTLRVQCRPAIATALNQGSYQFYPFTPKNKLI